MEDFYEVQDGNAVVGKVQLIRQGLYYRVICRCYLLDNLVRRLYVVHDGSRENLGVLVPEGDGIVLDRKIPAKKLQHDALRFILSTGGNKMEGKIIPVSPEEPFLYIDRLQNAFLETKNGKVCIRLAENPETA